MASSLRSGGAAAARGAALQLAASSSRLRVVRFASRSSAPSVVSSRRSASFGFGSGSGSGSSSDARMAAVRRRWFASSSSADADQVGVEENEEEETKIDDDEKEAAVEETVESSLDDDGKGCESVWALRSAFMHLRPHAASQFSVYYESNDRGQVRLSERGKAEAKLLRQEAEHKFGSENGSKVADEMLSQMKERAQAEADRRCRVRAAHKEKIDARKAGTNASPPSSEKSKENVAGKDEKETSRTKSSRRNAARDRLRHLQRSVTEVRATDGSDPSLNAQHELAGIIPQGVPIASASVPEEQTLRGDSSAFEPHHEKRLLGNVFSYEGDTAAIGTEKETEERKKILRSNAAFIDAGWKQTTALDDVDFSLLDEELLAQGKVEMTLDAKSKIVRDPTQRSLSEPKQVAAFSNREDALHDAMLKLNDAYVNGYRVPMTVVGKRGMNYIVRYGHTVRGFLYVQSGNELIDSSNVAQEDANAFAGEYAARLERDAPKQEDPADAAYLSDYLAAQVESSTVDSDSSDLDDAEKDGKEPPQQHSPFYSEMDFTERRPTQLPRYLKDWLLPKKYGPYMDPLDFSESTGYAPLSGNNAMSREQAEDKRSRLRRAYVKRRIEALPTTLMDRSGQAWPLVDAEFESSKKLAGEPASASYSELKRAAVRKRMKALGEAKLEIEKEMMQ